MRVSALLIGLFGSAVLAFPTQGSEYGRPNKPAVVGRVCTGTGLTGHCTPLNMTTPNVCEFAMDIDPSHPAPLRMTQSLEITARQPCAFFACEACINPPGIHSMFVQGPARVANLPDVMVDTIKAYICGENASVFGPGANVTAGTVIVSDKINRVTSRDERVEAVKADDPEHPENPFVGAVLYRDPDLVGNSAPRDFISIASDGFCVNMSNLFASWDGEASSLVVYKGKKCHFYTEYDCPKTPKTPHFELGYKDKHEEIRKLDKEYDDKIHSVRCTNFV
ncbi:hypothetical protein BCR34DRAFT_20437 [Clohesyomyces aquaticus]|uniref:Uncharacterized protein n=1 Tax=Clohesyomyces aquaticus TaxID=1231657 RepID=A0A1Y1ZAQ0_9PLEO|nr:hypothetical protein BCR34DRAFT_20437 [Clohesyomyces aquaticus]